MNQVNYKQAFEKLYRAGFSVLEINRLLRFRRKFRKSELDFPPTDRRHLEFIRWLVATGRLSERIV